MTRQWTPMGSMGFTSFPVKAVFLHSFFRSRFCPKEKSCIIHLSCVEVNTLLCMCTLLRTGSSSLFWSKMGFPVEAFSLWSWTPWQLVSALVSLYCTWIFSHVSQVSVWKLSSVKVVNMHLSTGKVLPRLQASSLVSQVPFSRHF